MSCCESIRKFSVEKRLFSSVSGAALAASLCLFGAGHAAADDECGAPSGGSVTCTGSAYAGGITYALSGADNLAVTLDNPAMQIGGNGVNLQADSSSTGTLTFNGTRFDTITGSGPPSYSAAIATAGLGSVAANIEGGTITSSGGSGLIAQISNGASAADVNVHISGGTVINGASYGVVAGNQGSGAATITIDASGGFAPAISGTSAAAIAASSSTGTATAIMNAGSVRTTLSASTGIEAQSGSGSAVARVNGGTITTTGNATLLKGASGIYARNNAPAGFGSATAEMTGGIIGTSGQDSDGVYSLNQGTGDAVARMSGGTVTTTGDSSKGISVQNYLMPNSSGNMTASLTGGTIATHGNNPYAQQLGSYFDRGATGVYAYGNTTGSVAITMNSSSGSAPSVTTTGSGAHGLYAYSLAGPASIDMDDGTVTVSGAYSVGAIAYVRSGGQSVVRLMGGAIHATGDAQAAVGAGYVMPGFPAVNALITIGPKMIIDASGATAGYSIWNGDDRADAKLVVETAGTVTGSAMLGGGGATFTLSGGSFTGDIYGDFDPAGTPAVNQGADAFIWSGGTLSSGFYGQGGNDTALISVPGSAGFASVILDGGEDGGAPESRISTDFDAITFAGSNDSVSGRNIRNWEKFTVNENVALAFIDDGMTLDGYDGGNANGMGDLAMLAGSSITAGAGPGQGFTLSGNLSNQGMLSMQDGAFGGNIIIEGDYSSNGGRLGVDVDFGALQADVLTLGGDIGGVTQIEIADIGASASPGAVLLVNTVSATGIDMNEFKLDKNQMTASGIYAYGLVYNLDGDPGSAYPPGVYLSATEIPTPPTPPVPPNPPVPPTPPAPPTPPTPPIPPNPPTPPSPPAPPIPPGTRIQPFIPLYEGYQSVLLEMNRLPTMRQRVGKRYWLHDDIAAAPMLTPKDEGYYTQQSAAAETRRATPALDSVWGRVEGGFDHMAPASSTLAYDYDLSQFEAQAGIDGLFLDNGNGRLIAGLTGHYRTGEARFSSPYGSSRMLPDGWGLGGTLTWLGENGFYTDAQAEVTWYSAEMKADALSKGIENSDAFGYALSLEAGQQIGLGGNDMILTPQAQLMWSSVDVDSFTGAYNDDAAFNNGDSLTARIGVALERDSRWSDENGLLRKGNIYGIANLYYDFDNKTKTTVEQIYVLETELDAWTGEIGFGGAYDWQGSNKVSYGVYAELTASMGFDSSSYGYGGNVGFKVRW